MNIESCYNFHRITERLTTSGTVPADTLKTLAAQGYQVVVNLLPDTNQFAVPDEQAIVESQGIEYIHIPFDIKAPAPADFSQFTAAMDRVSQKQVHAHCAANYRVSAFYALYMLSQGRWNIDQARTHITGIWRLADHPGWPEFIAAVVGEVAAQELLADA